MKGEPSTPCPGSIPKKMALLFMHKVFTMLMAKEKISEDLAQKVASWPHSGFNIHNEAQIDAYLLPLKRRAIKNGLSLLGTSSRSNP